MGILTYILLAVPFTLWLIRTIRKGHYNKVEFIDCLGNTFVVALLLTVVIALMAGIPMHSSKKYIITKYVDYDIVSASQSNKIEGKVFLFSGYIKDKPVYKAYKREADGSYLIMWMYAETTKIIETDEVSPHITEYIEGEKIIEKWSKWHELIVCKKDSKVYKNIMHSKYLQHNGIIYIPKGTIKPTFDGMNL